MQLSVVGRFPLAGLWCLLVAGRLPSLPGLRRELLVKNSSTLVQL
ncbi:hypothetical protein [Nostoc sp.]